MMRKGIDPPHIVALTIVVCAAIAPAFMLWVGRSGNGLSESPFIR